MYIYVQDIKITCEVQQQVAPIMQESASSGQDINMNSQQNQMNQNFDSSRQKLPILLQSQQQNEAEQQQHQQFQDQILDLFQQARREQVLRQINQNYSESEPNQQNQQVNEILNRKQEREGYRKRKKQQQQMKKLRHQNAMEFFKRIKANILKNFKEGILQINRIKKYAKEQLYKLFSFFPKQIITQVNQLKSKESQNIKRDQFIGLIKKIFNQKIIQLEPQCQRKYQIIFAMANFFRIGFKKLKFIDLSDLQLESFYNLKYQAVKGKKKKINKSLDILKNKIQKKIAQQSLSGKNYVSLSTYAFDPKRFSTKQTQSQRNSQTQNSLATSSFAIMNQQIKILKRTFLHSYCLIYCPFQKNWKLFNMQIMQFQQLIDVKNKVLANKAIIGFYSMRILNFLDKFAHFEDSRIFSNIEFRDQTPLFCDKIQLIIKRRHRLGCKNLFKNVIKQSNNFKCLQIFSQFDRILIKQAKNQQYQFAKDHFPKSVKQMRLSDYFVVPSLVQKYMILKEGAQPLDGLQFHEEKVYSRQDLLKVSSRMGWIDHFRMVKQDENPVKTTQNRNKTATKLYTYSQTQEFYLKFTQQGQFILDEQYNSIYVPPVFQPPQGYILVPENVDYICKKHKYRCARIVQGFDVAAMHIVPNNIGFLVEKEYFSQIMKLHEERQQKLRIKKQSRRQADSINLWKKLFKSIVITQQV